MEPITTTFTTDPKMIMRSYRASHRRVYITRWIIAGALVVIGIVTPSIGLVAAGPILWIVMEVSVRRQLRAYLQGPRDVTVTMTEDEYRTQGPDRSTSRTWTTFERVSRVREFWVLRISTAAAMALPAAALDAEQTVAFEQLLRRKDLLRK